MYHRSCEIISKVRTNAGRNDRDGKLRSRRRILHTATESRQPRKSVMKIMLITPPYHCGVLESAGRWQNLAFVYVAGHLRAAGFDPVIYDAMSAGHDLDAVEARIRAEAPAAVLTTSFTASYPAAVEVLRAAKRVATDLGTEIVTGIGGVHATFMYAEILADHADVVDYCFRGEGEATAPDLMTALHDGHDPADVPGIAFMRADELVTTPVRPFMPDLDALIPAWDLVSWDLYTFFVFPGSRMATINTSRGCTQACSFCSQQKFWERTWRGRNPELVAAEILHLHETYGVDVCLISDELPTYDRERWERLLDLLIAAGSPVYLLMETRVDDIVRDEDILAKYRRAGVIHVYVGVEATSQEALDRFQKNADAQTGKRAIELLAANGMLSETSFVLGVPEETPKSIQRTLQMAKFYDPDMAHFLLLAPWPYADMWPELEPYVETRDYALYNLVEPVMRSRHMSRSELFDAVIASYMDFYMSRIPMWANDPDPFRRDYLMRSARLIMQNSFITAHLPADFEPPAAMREVLSAF
jgi:anaerobic magnesium-protoporphyrin IX monomethyl ester cyclase